jgi:hypothetical protein
MYIRKHINYEASSIILVKKVMKIGTELREFRIWLNSFNEADMAYEQG